MTISNLLGRYCLHAVKTVAISISLLAVAHTSAQAQTYGADSLENLSAPYIVGATGINPAKLKETAPVDIAQVRRRGRRGRDGTASDFVGLGLSLGTGDGDGALEELGLVAISKLSVTPQLAVRPTVVFNDSVAVLAPVTYNFESPVELFNANLFPYVGGGIAINATEDDIAPLVSAGVDVPFSERLTLNGQGNVTLADDITLNFMVGLG